MKGCSKLAAAAFHPAARSQQKGRNCACAAVRRGQKGGADQGNSDPARFELSIGKLQDPTRPLQRCLTQAMPLRPRAVVAPLLDVSLLFQRRARRSPLCFCCARFIRLRWPRVEAGAWKRVLGGRIKIETFDGLCFEKSMSRSL